MKKELEKTYNPSDIEDRLYKKWMDKKYFHAEVDRSRKPFTIVMPPPNITGQLHMGHALDNTLQDILIRFKRMQGYNALWIPGTDHASIATEAKIVEAMRKARKKEPRREKSSAGGVSFCFQGKPEINPQRTPSRGRSAPRGESRGEEERPRRQGATRRSAPSRRSSGRRGKEGARGACFPQASAPG